MPSKGGLRAKAGHVFSGMEHEDWHDVFTEEENRGSHPHAIGESRPDSPWKGFGTWIGKLRGLPFPIEELPAIIAQRCTKRQAEALRALLSGKSPEEISSHLNVSRQAIQARLAGGINRLLKKR